MCRGEQRLPVWFCVPVAAGFKLRRRNTGEPQTSIHVESYRDHSRNRLGGILDFGLAIGGADLPCRQFGRALAIPEIERCGNTTEFPTPFRAGELPGL